jgi:predicted kinase
MRPTPGLAPGFAFKGQAMPKRYDQRSDNAEAYRRWYKTERWQRLAKACYARDLYTCQRTGELLIGKYPAPNSPVANHKTPHKGNPELFWEMNNIETVSKRVHDGAIQSDERLGYSKAIGPDGWPTDPRHPALGGTPDKVIGTAKSHPTWFRQSYIPLTIVCGAPGSGKSTYVDTHAGPNDLVICFDRIARSMYGKGGDARPHASLTGSQVGDVLRQRNEMLGDLMRAKARDRWPAAWLIVSEPRADYRQWWQDRLKPKAIVVMLTPPDECKRRVKRDAQAGDRRHDTVEATIDAWWASYGPREGDLTA